jgi:hypothetical protein
MSRYPPRRHPVLEVSLPLLSSDAPPPLPARTRSYPRWLQGRSRLDPSAFPTRNTPVLDNRHPLGNGRRLDAPAQSSGLTFFVVSPARVEEIQSGPRELPDRADTRVELVFPGEVRQLRDRRPEIGPRQSLDPQPLKRPLEVLLASLRLLLERDLQGSKPAIKLDKPRIAVDKACPPALLHEVAPPLPNGERYRLPARRHTHSPTRLADLPQRPMPPGARRPAVAHDPPSVVPNPPRHSPSLVTCHYSVNTFRVTKSIIGAGLKCGQVPARRDRGRTK